MITVVIACCESYINYSRFYCFVIFQGQLRMPPQEPSWFAQCLTASLVLLVCYNLQGSKHNSDDVSCLNTKLVKMTGDG